MNAKKRARLLRVVMVVGALLLALVLVGVVRAATIIVDSFNVEQQDLKANQTTPRDAGSVYTNTGDILGDNRDAEVNWVEGAADIVLQIDYMDSNRASFSAGSTGKGWAEIVWDGDSDPDALDPDGLGGVDLYGGPPATNDGIVLAALSVDHDTRITITGYSTDTTYWSDLAYDVPGDSSTTRMDLVFPFNAFTSRGSSGGVNWANLGALVLGVDGTIVADLDLTIDFVSVTTTREFGDLPVGVYSTTVLSANHIPDGMRLGYNCDTESLYHSSIGADGDDNSDADDEDGVVPSSLPWSAGSNGGEIEITLRGCPYGTCYVHGWIDWNHDGDFDDADVDGADEHIVNWSSSTDRTGYPRFFDTPTTFTNTIYYARFRVCPDASANCDSPTSLDTDVAGGEVEDYRWPLGPTAVELSSFTAAWDGDEVQVAWATAQEVDTVGFNLWRSTSPEGGYVQVNDALIPSASPGATMGGSYAYADSDVTPGTTYYYKLEEVEIGGARNWYGPTSTDGGGTNPTAVTLSTADTDSGTVLAWWPVAAALAVGAGLVALARLRRRRQRL